MLTKTVSGRIFAIGDIHGCYNECKLILAKLKKSKKLTTEDQVIFLGDYIDRGSQSKQVIDLLIEFKKEFYNTIFLKGNHEDMLLSLLSRGGNYGEWYIHNGGDKTFKSYTTKTFQPLKYIRTSMDYGSRVVGIDPSDLWDQLPLDHQHFLCNLEQIVLVNDTIFVHAGLNPYKELKDQTQEDLLWIREDFIGREHKFNLLVVHGHTIFPEPYFNLPYEIGIDTGCFKNKTLGYDTTGKLTCLELDEGKPIESKIIQVKNKTKDIVDAD